MKTYREIVTEPQPQLVQVVTALNATIGQIRTLTHEYKSAQKTEIDLSAVVTALSTFSAQLDKIAAALNKESKFKPTESFTVTNNRNNVTYTIKVNR